MLPTFKLSQYKLMIPRLLFNWNSRKHVFVKSYVARYWKSQTYRCQCGVILYLEVNNSHIKYMYTGV